MNKMREEMAEEFLKALKENQLPWQKNWSSVPFRPCNAISQASYHGVNSFWLSYQQQEMNYQDPRWCTFHQAQEKGWYIKKGEKGTRVEFWSLYDTETKQKLRQGEAEKLKEILGLEKYQKRVKPLASVYVVFNAAQISGIPEIHIEKHKWDAHELIEKRDLLLRNMQLGFQEKEEAAFYRPSEDKIHMPGPERFKDGYSYFSTFLHEAGHATGHESRLNRQIVNQYGTPEYAREELRAEIASAFISQTLGLSAKNSEHMENHKAYIQSWISILEKNPAELFSAIKDAEKISDYLLEKGELEPTRMHELEEVDMSEYDEVKFKKEEIDKLPKEIPYQMRQRGRAI
ncbi:MAG: ssDNA-binding domain-containing protein [Clostridiaceae bacterium]|nr:ssDNA-binding domain-containing protein [Clostridiaceae bacterium]